MDTAKLKKFAQSARIQLHEAVASQLELVLFPDSLARRESKEAVSKLEKWIKRTSKVGVIERTAYIWFNRFCALRFMDVNQYTKWGTVSPNEGFTQPEILTEAKQGYIDDELKPYLNPKKMSNLLAGNTPSEDPQAESYRLLVTAVCNYFHNVMPFLFQEIADYTELLIPNDLLSENSVLFKVRETLDEENCKDVEVIGWLYQFYISEKKDEVFEGLKKNKKITPENIPAATQLFTPNWIVRYLVENSLGRLWMLNNPGSKLVDKMEYYIKPEQPESDFLKISGPEEIKICDPACGSGHILVYAFELLHTIYLEEGYEAKEIPSIILKKNLYGIEIDERAGELAAFALTMKARESYKRFFKNPIRPNVCVLQNISFEEKELNEYMEEVGQDLFTGGLSETLTQFEEADNFGSLIKPACATVEEVRGTLAEKRFEENMFFQASHKKVLKALDQANYLTPKYHVVIANPPYMGGKGMNARLTELGRENYPDTKSDLFAMFIERNIELSKSSGSISMITMQSWMFLSRHEKLRQKILDSSPIQDMAHLGTNAFDSIGGEVVSTVAFVLKNTINSDSNGRFIDLKEGTSEKYKEAILLKTASGKGKIFTASAKDFESISGLPIAYWLSPTFRRNFQILPAIKDVFSPAVGLNTGNNNRFLRQWFEVSIKGIYFSCNSVESAKALRQNWFPYNKGGTYRKWYGNQFFVLNWKNDGFDLKEFATERNLGKHWSRYIQNLDRMFQECITWSDITTNSFAARYSPKGFLFDVKGSSGIPTSDEKIDVILSLLCSKLMPAFMKCVNPTSTFQVGDLSRVPYKRPDSLVKPENPIEKFRLVTLSKKDWDYYETSWDFTNLPLLNQEFQQSTLKATYLKLRNHCRDLTMEMQQMEAENNRKFIEAYGLQKELTPEVSLKEITLTCNPHYRYNGDKREEELDVLMLADVMREFISYSVGCMFGRYALDNPGLILANQGEFIEDYNKQVPNSTFPADDDNVIPILDGEWFNDDITERFFRFLRITFGDEHYDENLNFLEEAIGMDVRKFFLKEFYNDHIKRYKKRPIYWLFSSPNGNFKALIYMHRYTPDTVSIVLNDYLREFRTKLNARIENAEQISISGASKSVEKTKALKEIEKLKAVVVELNEYETDVLYPLATQKIEIDLDDGVKVNYNKFGKALQKVPGLTVK